MERVESKVAFFIETKRTYKKRNGGCTSGYAPREVLAVFVDSGDDKRKECYAHNGQHSECDVECIEEQYRPAAYNEFKELYDELDKRVGYDMEVVDSAWWIGKATAAINDGEDA